MTPLNVFVTESNINLYVSKLHETLSPTERDTLLRLVAAEEGKMGESREHIEYGERRVIDGRECMKKQRILAAGLSLEERANNPILFCLETLEKTQELLEEHLSLLRQRRKQTKL